jgi:hypothetical protein
MATLTTVDFRPFTEFLDGFLFLRCGRETVWSVVVPTLEVPEAKLPFRVFFITGSLARFLLFDFQSGVTPKNWSTVDSQQFD